MPRYSMPSALQEWRQWAVPLVKQLNADTTQLFSFTIILQGLLSARPIASSVPSSSNAFQMYYATDTNQLFYSNGVVWVLVNSSASGGIIQGTLAARPAASVDSGVFYYATDTNSLAWSNGTSWIIISGGGALTAGTGLTGGGTLPATISIANTSVAPGSYGDGGHIPQIAINAQGQITGASNVVITAAVPAARQIISGTGLTGGGDLSADRTLALANTAVAPNTYGDTNNVPQIIVDAQGRITSATNIPIAGAGGTTGVFLGTVTLTTGTSTTVSDINTTTTSTILLMPLDADAASLQAIGWYIASRAPGTGFVITHSASTAVDRNFQYILVNGAAVANQILEGIFSSLPAAGAGNNGQFYYATDTGALYFSNGVIWALVSFEQRGTASSRPAAAAANTGEFWYSTDTNDLTYSNGSVWTDINVPPTRSVATGTGLSGGGNLTVDRTIALANTAVTPASYGDTSHVATFTVDQQGRLTAAGVAAITPASIGSPPSARLITAGTGLTGGGDLTADRTLTLANTAVAAGPYGDATHVPQVTIDAQGRITAATNILITAAPVTAGLASARPTAAAGNGTFWYATDTDVLSYSNGTVWTNVNVVPSRQIIAGTALTGGGDLTADRTLTLANTAVTTGTYGDPTHVGQFTVDAQGRITFAGQVAISAVQQIVTGTIGARPAASGANTGQFYYATDTIAIYYSNGSAWVLVAQAATSQILEGTAAARPAAAGANANLFYYATDTNVISFSTGAAWVTVSGVMPTRQVLTGTGLQGGGDLSADRTLSLLNTAVTPGAYGDSSHVATHTVDQQGRLTAAASVLITPASIGGVATARLISTGTGLSGGGDLSADRTHSLANTAVTPGVYGDTTHTPQITIDQQGRITLATVVLTSGSGGGGVPAGLFSARPAASAGAGFYYATDVNALFYSNATTWTLVEQSSGTTASRPAASAGNASTFYYSTDTNALSFSNGAAWTAINVPPTRNVLAGTALSGGGSLTSDVTVNLANTTVSPATYGDTTHVSQITVDQQGRITTAAAVPIAGVAPQVIIGTIAAQPAAAAGNTNQFYYATDTIALYYSNGSSWTLVMTAAALQIIECPIAARPAASAANANLFYYATDTHILQFSDGTNWLAPINIPSTRQVISGTGLTGGGDMSADRTLAIANTAVTPSTYGDATHVGQFTVNAQGQITAAAAVAITGGGAGVPTGTFAARPLATAGAGFYYATDVNELAYSNATVWTQVIQYNSGTAAARPAFAANNAGELYYSTDTNDLSYSTGAAWVSINTPPTRNVSTGTGLSGGGNLTADRTIILANTAVSPASYGDSSHSGQFTVDQQGRLTAAASVLITPAAIGSPPNARLVSAGTGMTGGGDLSADRTLTLANTAVSPASYGDSSHSGQFTVDQQGRLTAAASVLITPAAIGSPPNARLVSTGTGLTGGGDLSADRTHALANTAVTPAIYGDSTHVPQITIDQQGRITLAASVGIAAGAGSVSTGTYAARPLATAGVAFYYATDVNGLYYSNATVWTEIVQTGNGTAAARPAFAASNTGEFYYATDTNQLSYSSGAAWTNVNVLPARQILAGTGMSGGGDLTADRTLTLANTAVTPNPYGDSSHSPTFTVDQQGRLTAAANVLITPAAIGAPPNARLVSAGTGMTGGGDLSADRTLTLANTAVTPAVYGDASHVAQVTVDQQGRITLAANVAITGGAAVTAGTAAARPTAAAGSGTFWYATDTDQLSYSNGSTWTNVNPIPTTTISAGTGMTGGGDLTANRTLTLANTAVTPNPYGDSSHVATFTVDQQGRLTAAAAVAITPASIAAATALQGVPQGTLASRPAAGSATNAFYYATDTNNLSWSNGSIWTMIGGAGVGSIKLGAYSNSTTLTFVPGITSASLNSLAAGAGVLSSAIDNSVNLNPYGDFELSLASATYTSSAAYQLYLLPSFDGGTSFATGGAAVIPSQNHLLGTFYTNAATTAQIMFLERRPLTQYFKLLLWNVTGSVALPSSGNNLYYNFYNLSD